MHAEVEVTLKFDGSKKGQKLKLSIPNVQSKWMKKDVKNMAKWEGMLFDSLRRDFPLAK